MSSLYVGSALLETLQHAFLLTEDCFFSVSVARSSRHTSIIDWTGIRAEGGKAPMAILSAVALYGLLLLYTCLVGLRSFSKMSGFDFAITIAVGAVLASVTP